jgi:hypothetical protein
MREYDLELSERAQSVVSPFTSSSIDAVIPGDRITPFSTSGPIISSVSADTNIVYPGGSAHAQGPADSPYLIPVLKAPRGSYLVDEAELAQGEDEQAVEAQLGGKGKEAYGYDTLVSVFQTRDNARAGFVGSAGMLSDKYWSDK